MHPLSLCPPTLCVRVLVIFHVHGTCMASYIYVDFTMSEPLETFQPSRFKPPVTLSSQYSTKTLEGSQTLSEPPPVKGKCTCPVHVTHLLVP